MITLAPQQEHALREIREWFVAGGQEPFYLAGYAGSGKTTLAKLLRDLAPNVMFAAYTGKAALVLTQKGCPAVTIHSLIYVPKSKSRNRLERLQRRLEQERDPVEQRRLLASIEWERANVDRPSFSLREETPLRDADLLVVDEVSMINEGMAQDLLSFGTPVLVLGDPGQLPPVRGEGFFTARKPDVFLTEIHRQARDNPIIDLATRVRQGEHLRLGQYGESRVLSKADEEATLSSARMADQVLCGLNKTRRAINAWMRKVYDFQDPLPVAGDRLVCLRNDKETGLLNGGLWTVTDPAPLPIDGTIDLTIRGEDGGEMAVEAWIAPLIGEQLDMNYWKRCEAQEFDYGYALTVHKAQGSGWPHVMIYDESHRFDRARWLYTALTRAAQKVTVVT